MPQDAPGTAAWDGLQVGFWVVCLWADAWVRSDALPCMPCVGRSVPPQVGSSSSAYRSIAADTFLTILVLHLCSFSFLIR